MRPCSCNASTHRKHGPCEAGVPRAGMICDDCEKNCLGWPGEDDERAAREQREDDYHARLHAADRRGI